MRVITATLLALITLLFAAASVVMLPTETSSADLSGCTWIGTQGRDVHYGTAGDDVLCGRSGNDYLNGLGGDDMVRGGRDDDTLVGGEGKDTVWGKKGTDKLFTVDGRGGDYARGGPLPDFCFVDKGDKLSNCMLTGEASHGNH
jgi:Ca2+-binding RTX toxin-like protein